MRIEVTQEDIAQGSINNCHTCPVARAIGRAFGIEHGRNGAISVRSGGIYVRRSRQAHPAFDCPPAVRDFIADFDHGEPVQAFAFDLPDIPLGADPENLGLIDLENSCLPMPTVPGI